MCIHDALCKEGSLTSAPGCLCCLVAMFVLLLGIVFASAHECSTSLELQTVKHIDGARI